MLVKALRALNKYSFLFKKQKPQQTDDLDFTEFPNLGPLIQNIKKGNVNKQLLLPPQKPEHQGKLTVVLEMDQVLSYTFTPDDEGYMLAPMRKYDFYYEFDEYDELLSIYKRKNLQNFLSYVSQQCEPVIFSTGLKKYVELVMSLIDPEKKIEYILTQQHCNRLSIESQKIDEYVKDLSLLGRDMNRVVYFDCKPFSYWLNPENCYPIQEFTADNTMQTEDMNWIIMQIQKLKKMNNVQQFLKNRFKIRQMLEDSKML